jgi:Pyruvate/2-oxoacid:ferredoxin oxidoreductase delta subunit
MNIQLRYFSGTGNSWTVLKACQLYFNEHNCNSEIKALDINEKEFDADIIGLAFPIHAFGLPEMIRKYIKSLPAFPIKQKIFFIMTAGDVTSSCSATKKLEQLLLPKNAVTIYSDVIKMPNNWIPFSHTASKEVNEGIINAGVKQAKEIAENILKSKISKFHTHKIPTFLRSIGNTINVLFRSQGKKQLVKLFRTYDSCDGCSLCALSCPTNSIEMINDKPNWSSTCVQCMRCVNICPQESIYQKIGGNTKGKDRYMAPGFDPLKQ